MGFWIGSLGGSREAQGGQEPSLVLQSRSRSFLAAPTLLFDKLTKNVLSMLNFNQHFNIPFSSLAFFNDL